MEFLWSHYQQKDKPRIFYRFKKKWMNFTVRELAKSADCSVGMVNKTLNLLKSENLVEYEFISFKGYGKRITPNDNKCVFFTAKGRAIFSEIFPENNCKSGADLQCEKEVNTIDPKAVKLNNYNINKSGETPKTLKTNPYSTDSLCAKLYDEIERLKIPVKRNRSTARYIHAAAKKLACNRKIGIEIPTVEVISRFRRFLEHQIKWLKLHGYKVCLHFILKFKAIGAFLAQLFAPVYKKYEKVVKLQPKRKILLDGEDIIMNPDKYHKYCDLYGKENIQVKISDKQATCLSLEKALETLEILCGKDNIVIIKNESMQPPKMEKRGCFSFLGILERFTNNIN